MPDQLDHKGMAKRTVWRFQDGKLRSETDQLTVEEPVELKLAYGPVHARKRERISVNLLTPGDEKAWACGFLFCEGLLGSVNEIKEVRKEENTILVSLTEAPEAWQHINLDRTARQLAATASCGFCGKENLDGLSWEPAYFPRKGHPQLKPEFLVGLSEKLDAQQEIFSRTGSLHAAALFDSKGSLLLVKEDIGRHNALDKVIGEALLRGLIPLRDHLLWLSGRIGFELIQKASMAGVPIVAAVGAPSSMAIQAAEISGITIIGFLRNRQFNCYSFPERLKP